MLSIRQIKKGPILTISFQLNEKGMSEMRSFLDRFAIRYLTLVERKKEQRGTLWKTKRIDWRLG